MVEQAKGLFAECVFAFVPSAHLAPKEISEYAGIVEGRGGTVLDPRRDGSLRLETVSHIISNTIDFAQFTETQAFMIPVVNTDWIKASVRKNKQAQVRPFSPDPRMFFSKVMLTTAGLPEIDKETIIGATLAMGGMESAEVTRQTTHICALSIEDPKCVIAKEKDLKCKVILPHWFEDCFKLGKRIPEDPYMLPDPEILRRPENQGEVQIPTYHQLEGATSTSPNYVSDAPRKSATIFRDKKVMLSWDLSVTPRSLEVVKQLVVNGGGKVVDHVDDCDYFICQYRDGEQYIKAAQSGKDIGNLSWLYHLITHNEWTSPLRRLLHYPVPRNGIPGFQDLKICLSNYGGDARIYLENLIKTTGATYTKTMKAENTHLITARSSSEKYEAAKDWNIETVNHLWIEESYAKCEMQRVTVPKYSHFPVRTNLGEIIGQTFFDEYCLRETYYPGGEEGLSPQAARKRKILEAAQENSYLHGPAEGVVIGRQEDKSQEAIDDSFMTPVRPRKGSRGKENETPSEMSTGSRSAKSKALTNLQRIAPDIALYEKEKKRSKDKQGPWGGKRAADQIDRERGRTTSPPQAMEVDEEDGDQRPSKKRRSLRPEVEMRIVLTGFTRWVNAKSKEDAERRKLRDMGILIVQDDKPCDYLVAPHMVRTVKFLKTLAKGPTVLSSNFIDEALERGEAPDPDDFLLNDEESETKFGVKLETAVSRARANLGKLLWTVPVYCTANILNGPDSYKAIAEANGAMFKLYRARSGTTIKPTTEEEDGGAPPEPVYLLSSNSADERSLWPKFEEMARKGHMEPRIVAADWLLDVAMKQQVSFDEKYLARIFFRTGL
ncbi:BRCA1 C Terminus domain-containing protein [Colletotrichum orchidophilum]|uniref:BRCA1 C Terminus domain-containing protein n=1 Tax=Colletotrichum orchidophilum TaxID=1209926 RepID=A0A1G4AMY5_9PEZI|nr:BRCA1 C Terminus domain-containing protein [Colletotrichum orchidophilum]OHE90558.1 BRCA1 C Terminus domain-containing protein [Colletotrichum orchidophilum]